MTNPSPEPELISKAEAAEPLYDMVHELHSAIALLRTVWIALGNPRIDDDYGPEYCRETLEFATDIASRAMMNAKLTADDLVGEGG